ncbi:biotin-dependent carboxyltransferase family protein [Actinocorallia sp. A-T 12471]|uniref:5-oxoprolinase subunit C family protein n=1 Tax=Actinocorallia sp. A-T 12471 TaxID=3089813 RepID=UPI0029D38ED1|nr:biotin-dependent carboxyltransferase family protein [Actinocorallia sp. A-T 12471]MDX6739903.1 biotin-dependent carboxyltransferase family protein [Actinocorallia sp. A-T 12471]
MIEVLAGGALTTVQDLGRAGLAHLGVPKAGAADTESLALANRLVGNPEDAAGLELTFGGARLRFVRPAWVAVTGAPVDWAVDGRGQGCLGPCFVPGGAVVRFGTPERGLRSYLAVRGGIAVPEVLGSRSTDLLSGLGPVPLAEGMTLPVGRIVGAFAGVDVAPRPALPAAPVLAVVPGPRADWFTADALRTLFDARYEVTDRSNRVGVRLDGPPLERARAGELPSEGMVTGALQVPPDGKPILFLADHPTTGGYPVIAVVAEADLGQAAQLRPGDGVRFRRAR